MNCQIQWSPNVTRPIKISVVHISTNSLIIRSGWLITVCLWVGISIILLLFHRVAKNVVVGSKTKSTCPSLPFHGIFICIHLLKMSSGKRRNDNYRTLNINFFFWRGWGDCPQTPLVWSAFGVLTFLSVRTPSKSHATLLKMCPILTLSFAKKYLTKSVALWLFDLLFLLGLDDQ